MIVSEPVAYAVHYHVRACFPFPSAPAIVRRVFFTLRENRDNNWQTNQEIRCETVTSFPQDGMVLEKHCVGVGKGYSGHDSEKQGTAPASLKTSD